MNNLYIYVYIYRASSENLNFGKNHNRNIATLRQEATLILFHEESGDSSFGWSFISLLGTSLSIFQIVLYDKLYVEHFISEKTENVMLLLLLR